MRFATRRTLAGSCLPVALALACALPVTVAAQIFKCVDATGHTTYQQTPCPADAKGGRVELFVDNGTTRDQPENEAAWEAAARDKNVAVGMPARYVRMALGAPLATRPGRPEDNAGEVWSYPEPDAHMLRLGFRNGAVAWMRHDLADADGGATADDEATQRVLRRRNVAQGQDCSDLAAALGPADRSDGDTPAPGAPPGVMRYTWEPAQGDPFMRTTVTCASGQVVLVERTAAR